MADEESKHNHAYAPSDDSTLGATANGDGNGGERTQATHNGDSEKHVEPPAAMDPSAVEAAKPPAAGPPPVPDGGLQAWLQVAGAYMLFFNTWGILNTFGIFQTYYESGTRFTETSSNIAWIGSIQAFLLLFVGSIAGPIYDRGYLKPLVLFGSFMTVFGYMMLSLCHTFWEVILTQGFCIGIGGGCLFVPAVSVLPGYFRKHLGLAVGIAAAGSSMGGVIYPIVFFRLINRIGFGWTTRVLGFMALGTLLLPILVMKQRVKPPKARDLIDRTAFTDVPYLIFVFASFLGFIGLYNILFYISYFGASTRISDYSMSFYIVPILNAASVFGRTLPNFLSDYTGPINLLGPGAIIVGILILCMMSVKSLAGLVVEAVMLGFFTGVFVALPPVCFAMLTKDKTKIGTRIGMGFGILSLAVLAGGPGTGGIVGDDMDDLHWKRAWAYGGTLTLAGGAIYIALRFWMAGGKLRYKV